MALTRTLALPLLLAGLLGSAGSGLEARSVRPAPAAPEASRSREMQLRNSRTGFTCSMRVLRVDPSGDSGIVAKMWAGRAQPDPIVRNDLSPCLE